MSDKKSCASIINDFKTRDSRVRGIFAEGPLIDGALSSTSSSITPECPRRSIILRGTTTTVRLSQLHQTIVAEHLADQVEKALWEGVDEWVPRSCLGNPVNSPVTTFLPPMLVCLS